MYRLNVQITAYGRQTVPDRGVFRSYDPLQNFGGSNHMTGTAEPKVVKFCTRVGYINSNNRMTYHQQKGCGCGHVTVLLKFCRLSWCRRRAGLSATAELLVIFVRMGLSRKPTLYTDISEVPNDWDMAIYCMCFCISGKCRPIHQVSSNELNIWTQ